MKSRDLSVTIVSILLLFLLLTGTSNAELIHRWSFNGDPCDSIGGAVAELGGGATIVSNMLDVTPNPATRSWAELPIQESMETSVSDEVAFECWFQIDEQDDHRRLFMMGNTYLDAIQLTEGADRFLSGYAIRNGTIVSRVFGASQFALNTEYHVVVIYKKNVGTRLYVNGIYQGAGATSTVTPSDFAYPSCYLGQTDVGAGASAKINEFRIYNDALTPEQIMGNYNAGADTYPASPYVPAVPTILHRWSFNGDYTDSVGTAAADPCGAATITNNALDLTSNGLINDPCNPGDPNNQHASWAELPIQSTITTLDDEVTFETWVNIASYNALSRIYQFGSLGTASTLLVMYESAQGEYLEALMWDANGTGTYNSALTDLPSLNEWHHVVYTISKTLGIVRLYIDGLLTDDGRTAVAPADIDPNGLPINAFLGRYTDTRQTSVPFFNGKIDELRIYSGFMSDLKVLGNYNCGPDVISSECYGPGTCEQAKALGYFYPCDLDEDCRVNLRDLALFAENWNMCIDPENDECIKVIQNGQLDPNVIHRWSFNGDYTDSVGAATADPCGSATITNNALDLASNPDAVSWASLPVQASLSALENQISFEAWYEVDENILRHRLWAIGDDYQHTFDYQPLVTTSGVARYYHLEEAIVTANTGAPPDINTPVHIVVTYDKDDTLTAYINGSRQGSASSFGVPVNELGFSNNLLGANFLGDSYAAGASALIDEFRIYNKVLSQNEVDNSKFYGPDLTGPTTCEELLSYGYSLAYDLNNNCYIDLEDLAEIISSWLNCFDPSDESCDDPWN